MPWKQIISKWSTSHSLFRKDAILLLPSERSLQTCLIFFLSQSIFKLFPIVTGPSPTNIWDYRGFQLSRGINSVTDTPCPCLSNLTFMPHGINDTRKAVNSKFPDECVRRMRAPLWDPPRPLLISTLPGLPYSLADGSLQSTETGKIHKFLFLL